ncbi:MAG: GGDEF domain-containing protein [Planctomycetota bacterium]|jgi:diguanylate cyclase (GGDEF)-like protein
MSRQTEENCLVRLASVAEAVANAAYAEQGVHSVVQAAADLFHAQTVAVVLYDAAGGDLSIKLSRGLSAQFVDSFSRPLGTGVLAEIVRAGMALRLGDSTGDREAAAELRLEHDFASAVAVQLSINRKPLGYIYCDHRDPDHFAREDVQVLRSLGHLASLAIEKAELQDEVARLTVEDPVTGLATYNCFYARLCDEVERALRYGDTVGLMLVELTNLTYVEDVYGRPASVEVIRHAARLLQENTRGIDFAARFGSSQIMLCLIRADEDGLRLVADRIVAVAGRLPAVCEIARGGADEGAAEKAPLSIEVSLGGVLAPRHGREAAVLVSKVQNALLTAKRLGAGRCAIAEA